MDTLCNRHTTGGYNFSIKVETKSEIPASQTRCTTLHNEDLPSSVREELCKLSNALANSIGPSDSSRTDTASSPEVPLSFTGRKVDLKKEE